ncbi:HEAT repeat domain-containing protein [Candidatus Uabimicrobium amorphum]|uniref:Uncharacterized protein n=1 Tax=Uabimicrobium amorphum TaxID=2596890 RepID=A0A5S9F4C7_UABAM|nr:HEAT repeat domain-containing protein [Candidatus Uabimicrobium amorphum]BBM85655.1 hypothetical protein UABAM_04029 [Candidatus Uabimicrobium amorphum]
MKHIFLITLVICVCFAQEITFPQIKFTPSEKRINTQSFGFKLAFTVSMNGRRMGQKRQEYRQISTKEELILATDKNYVTKVKAKYRNAQVTGTNGRLQRMPISGKEYLITAQNGNVDATYPNGRKPYLPQEIQLVGMDYHTLGKDNAFSNIFAGNTFAAGKVLEIPTPAVKALLGENLSVKSMTCTVKETRVVNDKPCLILDATADISIPMGKFVMDCKLSGEMAVRLDTSEVISSTLLGPITLDSQVATPQGNAHVKGQGTAGISIGITFDGLLGCIDAMQNNPKADHVSLSLKVQRLVKHKDSKLLPKDAYAKIFLQHAKSENPRVRAFIARSINSVEHQPEFVEIITQYLQDEEKEIAKGAAYSCSRSKDLLQPQVKEILRKLYEEEEKQAKPDRTFLNWLGRCLK